MFILQKIKSHLSLILGIICVIFLIVIVILINDQLAYEQYVASQETKIAELSKKTLVSPANDESQTKEIYPQDANLETVVYPNFEFNYFDDEVRYPASLRNMPVSNYSPIKCASYYISYEYFEKGQTEHMLRLSGEDYDRYSYRDEKVIAFIQAQSKLSEGLYIEDITHCESNGRDIVLYTVPKGGGGGGNIVYVGYLDSPLVEIPNGEPHGGPYWGCNEPILSTKDEKFYIRCGSGDAGYATRSIFEIDLRNKNYEPVLNCVYTMGDETVDADGNSVWEQNRECTE